MRQSLAKALKLILVPALLLLALAGCGTPSAAYSYPLESVVAKDGGLTSKIYRAENKAVPEVAAELSAQRTPDEISKEDEKHMFLVYADEWIHLQQDEAKPSDTLIEVDSKEFVRQNYDPSFLEGYILGSLLSDLFDGHKSYPGSYRGYTTKDVYKPAGKYRAPTAKELKQTPPVTTERSGSIIKRGAKKPDTAVGAEGSLTKKRVDSTSGQTGKIIRSDPRSPSISDSSGMSKKKKSVFSSPKRKSAPRTKVGGFGRITKRR
ncbi:DUF4247 domain-containing protein [Brevibacillus composti]|uniref:DUF4247 domain-containing protein n=1 Tax=Brevibacillus composti TaxID=2796470 RepID=A0A7T5JPY6_9BACL|nr:DUF4247 domain-containing protein [Brevibacillus composti]QQE75928.1 DUF4247 domain-containing protein [Brevibacillus composti]QUO42954.1 DUF4247 domain-containing protein [Brevibacillus composti]